MSDNNDKTVSKQYRKYRAAGGTLTFKEWITREKAKGVLNTTGPTSAADSVSNILDKAYRDAGRKTELENKYIFGVPKTGLVVGLIVVAVAVGGFIYYKKKIAKK